jgi:hypothetical protein
LKIRLTERTDTNYQLSKDYFQYKHQTKLDHHKLKDNLELARVENDALKQQLDSILGQTEIESKHVTQLFEKKTSSFA